MVTELVSSYWRAHLVESYCKVSDISDTNWLRYLFSSYLNKIWLSVWHHHLANLHILKTWISLERKEIFENSKQHFSAHEVYLFLFQNGLDRKDVIFVIVPLWSYTLEWLAAEHFAKLFKHSSQKAGSFTGNFFKSKSQHKINLPPQVQANAGEFFFQLFGWLPTNFLQLRTLWI